MLCFYYLAQEHGHAVHHALSAHRLIGEPHESHMEHRLALALHGIPEPLLLQSVGLAELSLCPVAIHGMAQATLRDGEEHLHHWGIGLSRHATPHSTHGVSGGRLTANSEKMVDVA